MTHLVIAGTARQFDHWLWAHPELLPTARYIQGPQDLRGYNRQNVRVHLVGTCYSRPDALELEAMLTSLGYPTYRDGAL